MCFGKCAPIHALLCDICLNHLFPTHDPCTSLVLFYRSATQTIAHHSAFLQLIIHVRPHLCLCWLLSYLLTLRHSSGVLPFTDEKILRTFYTQSDLNYQLLHLTEHHGSKPYIFFPSGKWWREIKDVLFFTRKPKYSVWNLQILWLNLHLDMYWCFRNIDIFLCVGNLFSTDTILYFFFLF